jgi:hypothetical protein
MLASLTAVVAAGFLAGGYARAAEPMPGKPQAMAASPVQEFRLQEHFGVAHSTQVVTFDLDKLDKDVDPKNCYLLNDAGEEVPFQKVAGGTFGSIALSMDLPANTTRTFKLMSGRAPNAFAGGVGVSDANEGYLEITNGIAGVRVPKVYAPLTNAPKCPIQGVRFRDGTWSSPGTPIVFRNNNGEGGITSVDAMTVSVKEAGPIRVVVEVNYAITCPEMGGGRVRPAGPAHYTTTFTLEKDQPSVLIETDTDLYSTYSFSLYAGVKPTLLRYQGHHATDPKFGRLADGSVYPQSHMRRNMDALVDVSYDTAVEVGSSRPWLALWNPWASNSGWYWQMYDAAGAANSNAMGIFAGAPGRLISAGGGGPGIYTRPGPDAGVSVLTNLRGPDSSLYYNNTSFNTIRFAWGLHAGTRAEVPEDLKIPSALCRQYVLHGSGINLQKLSRWQLDYADPTPPFGSLYMPRPAIEAMIQRIRTDEAYYRHLHDVEPGSRDIFDLWRDTTGAKVHAMVERLHKDMQNLVDEWANGHGYMSIKYHNQPWLIPPAKTARYDQVLGSEFITPEERSRMKAGIALFANWLWDDDQYPFQTDAGGKWAAGVNMGTANMPGQWVGARSTYTWFIAAHPAMAPRLNRCLPGFWMINDAGANNSCPHYAGTFTPQHNVVMQRKMLGHDDWKTEPKLAKHAEWYMNLLTPAEVRFGGVRSVVVDGDGEANGRPVLFGEMATACADSQPVLSRRLMWLWKNNGKVHSDFYSSSVLRVNEELPAEDPKLGNATFPGYYSVLRSAWNTPKETSAHCIMGDFYSDHRGDGSSGQLILYALGAPLSVGWESMYSPHNPTPYSRNTIVPEASLPMAWNADLPNLGVPVDPWERKTQRQGIFASFPHSGSVTMHAASGADLDWTRHVLSIHPNDDYPLFLITDRFTGKKAGDPLIQNWSMMSSGAVATPAGDVTPGESVHPKMPSGGPVHPLKAGLSKFSFTGQSFGKAGVTPAIDWDLYSVAPNDRQFCLGSWGHNSGGSLGGRDGFQAANGKPYEQRQHLLHIMGAGGFTTLIVPRLKGAAAPAVTQEDEAFKVAMPGGTALVSADGYTYTGADKTVATAFGAQAVAVGGLSAEGGPTEVVHDKRAGTITVTAHGPGGKRLVGVPEDQWRAQDKVLTWDAAVRKWTLDYVGGKPGEAKPATAVLKGVRRVAQ